MTPEEVKQRVEALAENVRTERGGDEADWHKEADEIKDDALRAIAEAADNPEALATAALAVNDLSFARWYA